MNDTINDPAASMANEASDTTGRIVDAKGRAVSPKPPQSIGATLDQFGDYVRQQPFSTALLALGVGYIIGRLRLF
jgi:ElaB/YqjD/DUF883 family membrane-anchored ribosome-binding protein